MQYKPYGQTSKEISVVGCGGMRFANPDRTDENAEIVLHAYRRGINYFDTAPGYDAGKSELIMGAAFKQMAPGTYYVSTKSMASDAAGYRRDLEQSLDRMGLQKVSFHHIWCITSLKAWRGRVDGGAVAEALKAKQEGLVEHVVVSSHLPGDELAGVLEEGPFEGVTVGYGAINFPYREKALEVAGKMGIGVVAMNPLGGGIIPHNAERFDFIRGDDDATVVEAAVRFDVSHPTITSALVGFSAKAHVDQVIDAVENFQPYDAAHYARLREKIIDGFGDLCTGCGYCLPCPNDIEIPKMMDAYNMKVLSGNDVDITNRLAWHWSVPAEQAKACSLCGDCEERCTQHLPIRERMEAIADLAEKKAD